MFVYFRAPISWDKLARRTIVDTFDDGCPGLAAQLAFYFLLALFPALLFLVALLAYLPIDPALNAMVRQLDLIVPPEVLSLMRQLLEQAFSGVHGGLITLAVAGALWSSSSAMTAIITALNRAYDIEESRSWWQRRLVALVLTIGLSVFVVLALVLVVGGADLAAWLAARAGATGLIADIGVLLQWLAAFAFVVLAVDLVYFFAPNADSEWVWLTPGALLATVLWLATSFGFKLYIENIGSYAAVQGAIGGVITLMLWFYLSGFALLIGAELNAEIDRALPTHDDTPQGPGHARKKIGPAAEKASGRKPRL